MDAFSRTAELSSCNNDGVFHKIQNVYYDLALYRRNLMTKDKKKKMSCDAERCKIRELHKMIFKNIKFSFYSDLSFREIALPSISIHMKIGINAFIVSFLPLFDGE